MAPSWNEYSRPELLPIPTIGGRNVGGVSDSQLDASPADEVVVAEVALPDGPPTEVVPAPPEPANPVPVVPAESGYTADGVPTFDYARERIETRYGAALGGAELAAETPQGRSVEEQYEARQRAAAEKLEQIRASMRDESDQA